MCASHSHHHFQRDPFTSGARFAKGALKRYYSTTTGERRAQGVPKMILL